MAKQSIIVIGHGAYPRNGANALRVCFSRASAIRVLRARGLTRDAARSVLKRCDEPNAYVTSALEFDTCEVACVDPIERWQWSDADFKRNRSYWSKQAEA